MENKVLSIEIGLHKTKICVVDFKKRHPKVYNALILDTPYDSIEDGYIKDKTSLSEAIHDKLREAKIRINSVVFTISSSKIANREVVIPLVKKKQIQEVVNAGAADYFPIDVAEYNITFTILEKVNTKEEKNYRLLVLAAHNNLILSYYELAYALNFKVESIDFRGNSVFQIIRKQNIVETNMFIQINDQNTLINVVQKEVLVLQRTIAYGSGAVVEALLENPYYKVENQEQGVNLLRKDILINAHFGRQEEVSDTGALSTDSIEVDKKLEEITAKEEVTESLRYLVNNITRVADYYATRNPSSRINTVYLVGIGSKFLGIENLFSNEIGFEIKTMDNLSGVNFAREILTENFVQSDFLTCVGATIAPVGMVPKQFTEKAEKKSSVQALFIICSFAIVTSIILGLLSTKMLSDAEAERDKIIVEINELKDIDIVYTDHTNILNAWTIMTSMDTLCYSYNEELGHLIKELELILPTKVTVHSFRATATDIMMDITVSSKESAAMTLMQLKRVSLLDNVKTNSITEQIDEFGITNVSFSITANYITPTLTEEVIK